MTVGDEIVVGVRVVIGGTANLTGDMRIAAGVSEAEIGTAMTADEMEVVTETGTGEGMTGGTIVAGETDR